MEGIHHLLDSLDRGSPSRNVGCGVLLGEIVQTERNEERNIVLHCNGLRIDMEDLRFASGLPEGLRVGDRVLLYSPDAQLYYIFSRVVG